MTTKKISELIVDPGALADADAFEVAVATDLTQSYKVAASSISTYVISKLAGVSISAKSFVATDGTVVENGMYLPAAGTLGLSAGSTLMLQLTSTNVEVFGDVIMPFDTPLQMKNDAAAVKDVLRLIAGNHTVLQSMVDLIFKTNDGDEAARFSAARRLLLNGVTENTNGGPLQLPGGITFPATKVAAGDANTFDDFERGFWTPTDGSGAGLTLTAPADSQMYFKLADVVFAFFDITYPATADTNVAKIFGLPFALPPTLADNVGGGFLSANNVGQALTLGVTVTDPSLRFFSVSGTAIQNVTLSGKRIAGVLVYPAAP